MTGVRKYGLLGAVFSLFAGFYYWFAKMSGRMDNDVLGQLHFWFFFLGGMGNNATNPGDDTQIEVQLPQPPPEQPAP